MPRDPPVVYLYPLSNYQQGAKGSLLEKDSSVKERMLRMAELYKKFGMRRVVEGLLIAHEHSHPFLLLLQIGNTYFKLPGGRLRVGEHETDGLRRKLGNKLGTPNKEHSINWQVGELVSTWWRPNFETVMYPYVPPQVAAPKESRKIFLTQLPPTGILGVPKNLKLLAVPLFELFDNAHRYGPVIASLPQLLARVKFIYCDRNAQPMTNPHINALQLTNIDTFRSVEHRKKMKAEPATNTATKAAAHSDGANHNAMGGRNENNGPPFHPDPNGSGTANNQQSAEANAAGNERNENQRPIVPNAAAGIGAVHRPNVQINPMMNQYQAQQRQLIGNLYAQNILVAQAQAQQRQFQMQHLMAQAQAQHILRIPTRPIANARVIVTPTPVPQSPQNNAPPPTMAPPRGQMTRPTLPQRAHPPPTAVNMPPPNSMHRRVQNAPKQ